MADVNASLTQSQNTVINYFAFAIRIYEWPYSIKLRNLRLCDYWHLQSNETVIRTEGWSINRGLLLFSKSQRRFKFRSTLPPVHRYLCFIMKYTEVFISMPYQRVYLTYMLITYLFCLRLRHCSLRLCILCLSLLLVVVVRMKCTFLHTHQIFFKSKV